MAPAHTISPLGSTAKQLNYQLESNKARCAKCDLCWLGRRHRAEVPVARQVERPDSACPTLPTQPRSKPQPSMLALNTTLPTGENSTACTRSPTISRDTGTVIGPLCSANVTKQNPELVFHSCRRSIATRRPCKADLDFAIVAAGDSYLACIEQLHTALEHAQAPSGEKQQAFRS